MTAFVWEWRNQWHLVISFSRVHDAKQHVCRASCVAHHFKICVGASLVMSKYVSARCFKGFYNNRDAHGCQILAIINPFDACVYFHKTDDAHRFTWCNKYIFWHDEEHTRHSEYIFWICAPRKRSHRPPLVETIKIRSTVLHVKWWKKPFRLVRAYNIVRDVISNSKHKRTLFLF